MTRKRRFQLAALAVLALTVLLAGVVMSAPEPNCPPGPPGEVCDPIREIPVQRMWVGIGGVLLAFLLFLAGALEGAFPEDETQAGS